jgi:Ankyrin repeats (3 copies)
MFHSLPGGLYLAHCGVVFLLLCALPSDFRTFLLFVRKLDPHDDCDQIRNHFGNTALMSAAQHGRWAMVRELLRSDVFGKVNASNDEGDSALSLAVKVCARVLPECVLDAWACCSVYATFRRDEIRVDSMRVCARLRSPSYSSHRCIDDGHLQAHLSVN